MAGLTEEQNTLEMLQELWIKEDTKWETAKVMGPHKKQLRAFSEDYRHRQTKLLGHVIRADNHDPMRKVTFRPNSIRNWRTPLRRVGRPKEQWTEGAKNKPGKDAGTCRTDKGTKSQTKEPNTKENHYRRHTCTPGQMGGTSETDNQNKGNTTCN